MTLSMISFKINDTFLMTKLHQKLHLKGMSFLEGFLNKYKLISPLSDVAVQFGTLDVT